MFQTLIRFALDRLRELLPFTIAGLVATGVDYGTLYVFLGVLGAAVIVAASLAFIFSTGTNFVLQKFWTYRDRSVEALPRQMAFFLCAALLSLVLNDYIFWAFYDIAHVGYVFAQVPATAAVSVVGFLASRYIFLTSRKPAMELPLD